MAVLVFLPVPAIAAPLVFTVNVSEVVNVDTSGGTPGIALDVGGVTRQATYEGGSGTSALSFSYTPQAGDLDLDGIGMAGAITLNGGTIRDTTGNALSPLTFTAPDTSGVKIDYPSLAMDFINNAYQLNGTSYGSLSAFLTAAGGSFTRNSIGTYFDSSGNLQTATADTPRFDHDPTTNAAKGILIEESRTNYLLESDDAANWVHSNQTGTLGGSVIGPGGSSNARSVTLPSNKYFYSKTPTNMPTGNYVASLWLKGTPGYSVGFRINSTNNGANQACITVPLAATWTRVSVSFNLTVLNTPVELGIDDRAGQCGTGTGGTVDLFGGQIEAGTFSTSYIPTSGSAVMRQADDLSLGTYPVIQQSAWSAFAQVYGIHAGVGATFLGRSANIGMGALNGMYSIYGCWTTNGTSNLSRTVNSTYFNGLSKTALGIDTSGRSLSCNNLSVVSDNVNLTGGSGWGKIGQANGIIFLNAHMQALKIYPGRLSDANLQPMTQ